MLNYLYFINIGMKNKKQFHLRTIKVDQFFNCTTQSSTDVSHPLQTKTVSQMRFSNVRPKSKKQIKSYCHDETRVNLQKYIKKKIGFNQKFGNLQINRKSLGQFLSPNQPIKTKDKYQMQHRRASLIKNRKTFHQIINTGKMFTEQAHRQQQQFQQMLSHILVKKSEKSQNPFKMRSRTEASTIVTKKSAKHVQGTRPKSVSMNKIFSSKKIDLNNPQPWQISVQDDSNFYLTYL